MCKVNHLYEPRASTVQYVIAYWIIACLGKDNKKWKFSFYRLLILNHWPRNERKFSLLDSGQWKCYVLSLALVDALERWRNQNIYLLAYRKFYPFEILHIITGHYPKWNPLNSHFPKTSIPQIQFPRIPVSLMVIFSNSICSNSYFSIGHCTGNLKNCF